MNLKDKLKIYKLRTKILECINPYSVNNLIDFITYNDYTGRDLLYKNYAIRDSDIKFINVIDEENEISWMYISRGVTKPKELYKLIDMYEKLKDEIADI